MNNLSDYDPEINFLCEKECMDKKIKIAEMRLKVIARNYDALKSSFNKNKEEIDKVRCFFSPEFEKSITEKINKNIKSLEGILPFIEENELIDEDLHSTAQDLYVGLHSLLARILFLFDPNRYIEN